MKNPERSAALARALDSQTDGLPHDFAKKVAALAEADAAAHSSWNDVGLLGAFGAMVGICVTGWLRYGEQSSDGAQWLDTIVGALAPHPWLVFGIAGVTVVQLLTFRRRTTY